MSRFPVRSIFLSMLVALPMSGGCCCFPRHGNSDLVNAQMQARELYAENQRLLAAYDEANQMMAGTDQERQALLAQVATADERLNNLMAELNQHTDRYDNAL